MPATTPETNHSAPRDSVDHVRNRAECETVTLNRVDGWSDGPRRFMTYLLS